MKAPIFFNQIEVIPNNNFTKPLDDDDHPFINEWKVIPNI